MKPPTGSVLWKSIIEDLRTQMPRFRTGDRFFSHRGICKQYNVSGITARRVLAESERDGLVARIPRSGTVVRKNNRQFSMWLIMPVDISHPRIGFTSVVMRIYTGVFAQARHLNVNLSPLAEDYLTLTHFDPARKHGFIIYTEERPETRTFLRAHSFPVVYINMERGNSYISVNRTAATHLGVSYLLSLGHRRIGFISVLKRIEVFRIRWEGYRQALAEVGLAPDERLVIPTSGEHPAQDVAAFKKLMALDDPPTAIFTGNDARALNILQYCRQQKIAVPDRVSIMGFDNILESSLVRPALTTVDTHLEDVGSRGSTMLYQLMAGRKIPSRKPVWVKPEVIIRETTAPPRKAD